MVSFKQNIFFFHEMVCGMNVRYGIYTWEMLCLTKKTANGWIRERTELLHVFVVSCLIIPEPGNRQNLHVKLATSFLSSTTTTKVIHKLTQVFSYTPLTNEVKDFFVNSMRQFKQKK